MHLTHDQDIILSPETISARFRVRVWMDKDCPPVVLITATPHGPPVAWFTLAAAKATFADVLPKTVSRHAHYYQWESANNPDDAGDGIMKRVTFVWVDEDCDGPRRPVVLRIRYTYFATWDEVFSKIGCHADMGDPVLSLEA